MKFRFVLLGPDDEPEGTAAGERTGEESDHAALRYDQRGAGIVRVERAANGRFKSTAVTNFTARIVRDILVDDGETERRDFGIRAELDGQTLSFTLSAAEFSRMGWVLNRLGPQAIIYPGQQQHARAAIQWLSGAIPQERVFAHLGWRRHGTKWVYLHAAGALGVTGPVSELQVQLSAALQHYQVRPPEAGELVKAVGASLGCLSVAPDRIGLPLLAAMYRAALGQVDFSVFLAGQTGVFKTALAALCQQHFGAGMDAGHLPANFASTGNALESLAFHAKDALLVVDDFAPAGGPGDGEMHGIAERLFRAAGNHQGRSRMSSNGRLSTSRPPRALVLATGEEVPRGHSIRARLLIVEVAPGEVDRVALSVCQSAGQQGHLAAAMGAFLCWVAGRYEDLQQRIQARARELRNQAQLAAVHARLPAALAELRSGWEIFLEFAFEAGAIGIVERQELERRSETALAELAACQASYHQASDPASRFVALLRAALATGRAHVAERQGGVPESAGVWGWRRKFSSRRWIAQGTRIGWVTGTDLFLEPAISFQVAQELAGAERIPVGEQTLRHRLRERGLLASTDPGRQMVLVRRTLEGIPRQVLHLKTSQVLG